jgi:uncharacterized DUF497 family protein
MGPKEGCRKPQETRSYVSRGWHSLRRPTPDHSEGEERQMTFGVTLQKRLIVVSHAQRKDRTRIISARLMNRRERVIYEEG